MESNNSRFSGEYSWDTVCLKEISLKIGSGSTPRGGESAYIPERKKFAFIRSQNVYDFKFDVSGLRFISDEDANKLKGVHLQKDDVLINITGDGVTFSRCCLVPEEILPAAVNQHVAIIRLDKSKCLPGYLMAYLCLPETKAYIESFNAGGSRRAITKGHIESFEIPLPPMLIQEHISRVTLGLLAKQSINTQINQTLEQMAQALFKSWFVDFDPVVDNALDAGFFEQDLEFSDELLFRAEARKAVREKGAFKPLPNVIRQLFPADFEECADPSFGHGGWVPKGWRVLPFGEFIERKSVGKKYDQKSASTEGKVPILDQGKSGIIGFHDDEPSVSASLDRPVIVFANHTCYMRLINFDFSAIQNVLPFTGRHVDTTWAFFATQGRVKFSEYKGHWPDFIIEKAVVPSLLLTTKFRDEIDSLLRITRSYELQNETLIKLRDTLLPKLISGELRLDEIEADLSKEEKPNSVGQRRDGWAATSPSSELHGCK